jgi:glutaredoxin
MNKLVVCLYLIGCMTLLIGTVMCVVAAFRQSTRWGLVWLFVPFACLVFLFKYWSDAKNGFLTAMAGSCVLAGLIVTMPLAKAMHPTAGAASHENKLKELQAQIGEERNHVLSLQDDLAKATDEASRQYQALSVRRVALVAGDQPAVHQFNLDAASYQKQVQHLKQLQQNITAANAAVDDLLSQQAQEAAKKQVVIYSTSWCPACKAAKQYMDSKGISYRDVDVEKSPEGADEYRSQGGTGSVPLIVVGDRKMVGFNSAELDSML